MTRPRVLVTRNIPAVGIDRIRRFADVDLWDSPSPPPRQQLLRRAHGCHGLLTLLSDQIDAELFDAAGDQLRVVSNYAVGFNNIDIGEAARRGIRVGNTPDVLTDATADLAVALLLAAARRLREGLDRVRDGRWKGWEPTDMLGQDLAGKTLGIVGLGRIGMAVAQRLVDGWKMRVLYTARHEKPEAADRWGARRVPLQQLLADSDFVSIHTDLNEQTAGLFDASAFAQMKRSAVLVNTSRGQLVDQGALHHALTSGQIFAAALDVTDPEPLPHDHPLVALDNCLIVPHIGSATGAARDGMARIAADNLIAGIRGEPLPCAVV